MSNDTTSSRRPYRDVIALSIAGLAISAFLVLALFGPRSQTPQPTSQPVREVDPLRSVADAGRPDSSPNYPACKVIRPDRAPVTCQSSRRLLTVSQGAAPIAVEVDDIALLVRRAEAVRASADVVELSLLIASATRGEAVVLSGDAVYLGVGDARYGLIGSASIPVGTAPKSLLVKFRVGRAAFDRARRDGSGLRFTFSPSAQPPDRSPQLGVVIVDVPKLRAKS
jgi:hypothetical protein